MRASFLLIIPLLLALTCCKPDDEEDTAGKGGTGVLRVTPYHHDSLIRDCRIFIKYNASDFPSGGAFDDSMQCSDVGGKPVATFAGLKTGKYYLFGDGFDTRLAQEVEGGLPYHFHTQDTQAVNVYVTEEGH